MAYTDILYRVDHVVATVTLNRPDKLNAWTSAMDADLRTAIEAAAADDAVRAIVITGAGRGFCAGADMSRLSRLSSGEPARAVIGGDGNKPGNFEQKFSYFLGVPKPIFAAINGPIAGIAVSLSLFCDFRYMAEGAKLTTAFARRGLIAEHGSAWFQSLAEAWAMADAEMIASFGSEDFKEGVAHFVEKRAAAFNGR